MALDAKAVAKNTEKSFIRNVVETEQAHLRHLPYAGIFAHGPNWLVKLTLGLLQNRLVYKYPRLSNALA